jgi:hypothetical protein
MKRYILVSIAVIFVFIIGVFLFFKMQEDSWVKDLRGVYVTHGNPSQTPNEVIMQQLAINDSLKLYEAKKLDGMNFSSQCLGTVDGYAVDIVHVPRIAEDNLVENQCQDYLNSSVSHFIELDREGNVVRVS